MKTRNRSVLRFDPHLYGLDIRVITNKEEIMYTRKLWVVFLACTTEKRPQQRPRSRWREHESRFRSPEMSGGFFNPVLDIQKKMEERTEYQKGVKEN